MMAEATGAAVAPAVRLSPPGPVTDGSSSVTIITYFGALAGKTDAKVETTLLS